MKRFFLCLILLALAGCGEREPAVITPPKDAAAVIEPFLKELAAGNRDKAAAYVSTAATDELATQFAGDHAKLAAADKLTPRFVAQTREKTEFRDEEYAADGHEVTLVYGARKNGKWTTATVRAYRYRDEPYKVEYWRVGNAAPSPVLNSGVAEKVQETQTIMSWMVGAMAVFGVLGLGVLIWLIRRKPQLVAPEATVEVRRSAATVRDE